MDRWSCALPVKAGPMADPAPSSWMAPSPAEPICLFNTALLGIYNQSLGIGLEVNQTSLPFWLQ